LLNGDNFSSLDNKTYPGDRIISRARTWFLFLYQYVLPNHSGFNDYAVLHQISGPPSGSGKQIFLLPLGPDQFNCHHPVVDILCGKRSVPPETNGGQQEKAPIGLLHRTDRM
jgi:hypothetical protein